MQDLRNYAIHHIKTEKMDKTGWYLIEPSTQQAMITSVTAASEKD